MTSRKFPHRHTLHTPKRPPSLMMHTRPHTVPFPITRSLLPLLLTLATCIGASAQRIALPDHLPQGHPRLMVQAHEREALLRTLRHEDWAREVYARLKERTDIYIEKVKSQPDWLYSRLQMNWKTHYTDVFINGESFDHNGGSRAPEPTVKFDGTRGTASEYNRPALDDIVPYDDDEDGHVTFICRNKEGRPMEKAHPSKTGRNISNINLQILGIARDAAFLYWVSGDEHYAEMAAGVLDVYLPGLYYRNVPQDLNHGHQQTLVGMTSFEVIHEDAVDAATAAYDVLHDYLQRTRPTRMTRYADALRKWADNLIANGVPHNNWNLFQALFILKIALVLDDDNAYADGKGRGYYLDYILNQSSIRQWSLARLADYGFDPATAIWAESPGYSSNVVCDYLDLADALLRTTGIDLLKQLPVLPRAAAAMAQYLFPNKMICGFGDTHPGPMRTSGLRRMVAYARKTHDKSLERRFTALLLALDPSAAKAESRKPAASVSALLADKPLALNPSFSADSIARFVSPLFHAPRNSWLVQRSGMNPQRSLMISLNGSLGNHQHANGISLELYGHGYVLAPDAGIGRNLYSGLDYSEYYSQFPAHNTVCVDGVSSYPAMMSQHAFQLLASYPLPQNTEETESAPLDKFPPLTFSEVSFLEPESQSLQVRQNAIVCFGDDDREGGYYMDVFRSRKQAGGDKTHDYFYHNLGQRMTLSAADGSPLGLQPTEELAFAGGHLYAYSYIYDKQCARTAGDVKATFTTLLQDGSRIDMNLWMRGDENREVFRALSPANLGYERMPNQPYKIAEQPVLTYVARQHGEAWNHPFVAILEPSSSVHPSHIQSVSFFPAECEDSAARESFAGISIRTTDGHTHHIFSAVSPASPLRHGDMQVQAEYAFISDDKLLLVDGTLLRTPAVTIQSEAPVSVLLRKRGGTWHAQKSAACTVLVNGIPL